jgi:hypothetical protein
MSMKSGFIDIFSELVDSIDTLAGYVDFLTIYRQIASIGRSNRQMSDPGPDWRMQPQEIEKVN